MNRLKYHKNAKAKRFYDNIFEKGTIPMINRLTRITDVSDHFPIFFSMQLTKEKLLQGVIKIKKKSF